MAETGQVEEQPHERTSRAMVVARETITQHVHKYLEDRIKQHQDNLFEWREEGGTLLPTEPDDQERRYIRERLIAAVDELKHVDAYVLQLAMQR